MPGIEPASRLTRLNGAREKRDHDMPDEVKALIRDHITSRSEWADRVEQDGAHHTGESPR